MQCNIVIQNKHEKIGTRSLYYSMFVVKDFVDKITMFYIIHNPKQWLTPWRHCQYSKFTSMTDTRISNCILPFALSLS
jgi:hypothetical protein